MIKWRPLVYSVIVVIVFLMLTVIAAVNYSGDEAGNRARQNVIYRSLSDIIESSQTFFKSWPLNIQKNENDDAIPNKDGVNEKINEHIEIRRDTEGLIIIMKNSKGELIERVLPILKKK